MATLLYQKRCFFLVYLTGNWWKTLLSSPNWIYWWNDLPKGTKEADFVTQIAASALPKQQAVVSRDNEKQLRREREVCQLYFNLKTGSPLITSPIPYRHGFSWWSRLIYVICIFILHLRMQHGPELWLRGQQLREEEKVKKGCVKQY